MYTIIIVCAHSVLKGHNIRKLFNLSFTFIYYLLRIMSNLIHIDEKNFNLFFLHSFYSHMRLLTHFLQHPKMQKNIYIYKTSLGLIHSPLMLLLLACLISALDVYSFDVFFSPHGILWNDQRSDTGNFESNFDPKNSMCELNLFANIRKLSSMEI